MTAKYVDSAAAGAANGTNWANAYTTVAAGLAGIVAGDFLYVAHTHSETAAAAKTENSPGTLASRCKVLSVNKAGSVPPVSVDLTAGAQILTTGANGINFSSNGSSAYWRGFTYQYGNSAGYYQADIQKGGGHTTFELCDFNFLDTTVGDLAIGGSYGNQYGRVDWYNCTARFDGPIRVHTRFHWKGGTLTAMGAANIFVDSGGQPACGPALIEGVDLSVAGSGKTLCGSSIVGPFEFRNCKLGASVTMAATPADPSGSVDVINCDSGSGNVRNERYRYEGTETTETTIVRTGGATDGVTPIARKYVTTANAKWDSPFDALPIMFWNDQVGSPITVTLYGISGGALNNDDIWLEIYALENSGFPIATIETTTKADILAAGSALTSDTSTWGGSTTKFKISKTFTPQIKGPLIIQPRVGKASTTVYLDPKPDVSGASVGNTYMFPAAFVNQLAAGGASGGLLANPGMRGGMI